jgi:CheY-like chemotaxis protein
MQPLHVLVVEDDTDLRETIAVLLQEEGYVVSTASNGDHALLRLARAPGVDVILADLTMPESDGFDFRRRQRADDRIARIPA